MAHRRSPDLLRQKRLVHPHQRVSRSPGRTQSDDQLGAGEHSRRPLRQLAREQRRLGLVAGTVLGNSAPGLDGWRGDHVFIGSIAELESLCRRPLRDLDLHRPAVDEITFVHPDNGRTYRRVAEVIDCWFDSGAMSYAQFHYPFENEDVFATRFPADYICEAIDQTRGWFYTLHAIATLVSDRVAFKNCICLAHLVDENGKKMSKSQGNIVDPYDVFDAVGADPLRWYLAARIAPEVQKRISVDFVRDVASTFINTYWNVYAFFVMYARLDEFDPFRDVPVRSRPEIDRWVLALAQHAIENVTDALERYDALRAGQHIEAFVDQLSNWYVRRNRRRFWKAAAGDDKQAAYLTLYECLDTINRTDGAANAVSDRGGSPDLVRRARAEAPMSVHMTSWPECDEAKRDEALIAEIAVVQRVVGLGRAAATTPACGSGNRSRGCSYGPPTRPR